MPPRFSTSAGTLSSPSLPTLPSELVEEILCRLPVKILLQLRCICKSWKSLILNDSTFAKKHLQHVKKRLIVSSVDDSGELLFWDSSISSVFSNVSNSTVTQTQLNCPISFNSLVRLLYGNNLEICSCHGILCFAIAGRYAFLWNPSLRRYNILPPLENPEESDGSTSYLYSFGYDHFNNNVYKVVAISHFQDKNKKNEVSVHTMGTGYWRRIHDFPYSRCMPRSGVFVSGTVNWLAFDFSSSDTFCDIVSLDLEKESYQQLLLPDFEKNYWTLGVYNDCLCIFANSVMFLDVWVMKEYGIKESWTKLYTIPAMGNHDFDTNTKVVYISEDDQFLIDFYERTSSKMELGVYDPKNGTLKFPMIQNINGWMDPEIYAESLISPCS